jgi:ABC-type sugar transport system ATPase subunit
MSEFEHQPAGRSATDGASAVVLSGVAKAFGGVQALLDVNLELRAGEIHALCGENGAGKSTLIKILAGVYAADAGTVTAWGAVLPPGQVRAAAAAGIAVIHQESTAFPELDAVDNLFLGRELHGCGGWLLDRRRMEVEAARWLALLEVDIDLRVPLGSLSLAQRQLVSMARALSCDCRLLILDEPTASLSSRETAVLFALLRRLRVQGVSVLYVSHRLEEVFALADRITVLRDGAWVATRPTGELDRPELIRLMVGREVGALFTRQRGNAALGAVRLEVTGLRRRGAFAEVSLSLRAGEIVGLAGLVGAGRSEVARCIMGLDRPDAGRVWLDGVPLHLGDVRRAIRAGLAMVAEDRQSEGLVLPLSVRENLGMVARRALAPGWIRQRRHERDLATRLVARLGVRTPGIEVPAETLSGGNQQKLVLGKWLGVTPKVLLLDEPTRGVDVGAKAEIHRLILGLAAEGVATLLISSELPEILALCDRVLVLRQGHLVGELPGATATQEDVLRLALPVVATPPCRAEAGA